MKLKLRIKINLMEEAIEEIDIFKKGKIIRNAIIKKSPSIYETIYDHKYKMTYIYSYNYTGKIKYDKNGNRLYKNLSNGTSIIYYYGQNNKLKYTKINGDINKGEKYCYDDNDRLFKKIYSRNGDYEEYYYDEKGNLINVDYILKKGNKLYKKASFEYNEQGKLYYSSNFYPKGNFLEDYIYIYESINIKGYTIKSSIFSIINQIKL